MSGIIDIVSGVMIAAGCFFVLVGAFSLLRLPEIYTRIHGASLIDAVGGGLIIGGMMFQAGLTLVSVKLLFILVIFFFTLPVATHALAKATLHEGITPRLAEEPQGDTARAAVRKTGEGAA